MKLYLSIFGTAAVAFLIAAFIMGRMEKAHLKELADARAAERAICQENAKLTEGASRAYQNDLTALRADYDRARRLWRETPCIPVAANAGGHSGPDSSGQLPASHGISAGALLEFARDCEHERLTVQACQGYVRQVWGRAK